MSPIVFAVTVVASALIRALLFVGPHARPAEARS